MKKRFLAMLLSLCMLLSMAPAAFATGTEPEPQQDHWAKSAVDALNKIYGNDVFSIDEQTLMTVDNVETILTQMDASSDVLNEKTEFNRALACEVLAEIFRLPVAEDSTAIKYLYDKNIINGISEDELDEGGGVTQAQFAVLAYRVLNSVGGGLGSSVEGLKPGTKEYFAWSFLAVRKAVPFKTTDMNKNFEAVESGFKTYDKIEINEYIDGEPVYGVETKEEGNEGIWNAWAAALSEPKIGGIEGFSTGLTLTYETYKNKTLLEGAVAMMDEFIEAYADGNDGNAPEIFSDVAPADYFYDSVMHCYDAGYITGLGNGNFEPGVRLTRFELGVLLCRIDKTETDISKIIKDFDGVEGYSNIQNIMKTAAAREYLSWAGWENDGFDVTGTVSREEAIADILKACAAGHDIELDLDSVNTDILERFSDGDAVSEDAAKYLAYAVSHGMLSGTSGGRLSPDTDVDRGQCAVLIYRTLLGLDETKMQDYREAVKSVLQNETTGQGGN